jgi:hypothetical protein
MRPGHTPVTSGLAALPRMPLPRGPTAATVSGATDRSPAGTKVDSHGLLRYY